MKKILLMILDGWGIATNKEVSAIDKANTPFVDSLYSKYSHCKLEASALAVGLPEGQMGNSEVGHMNIGAGRIVYQDLVKINLAIEDGSIAENQILKEAIRYSIDQQKPIHLMGLVSDGGVHSHINHLKGLCSILEKASVPAFRIHAFTDGRDTDPNSGLKFMSEIKDHIAGSQGNIASITGRYFAMDRDKRWERVKLAYDAMVNGKGEQSTDLLKSIENSYQQNITDEFLKPIIHIDDQNNPIGKIEEGDVVICFNFRTDRGREITQVLTQMDFPTEEMKKLDLHYVTLTNYDDTFEKVEVMYDKDNLKNTLGEVLSDAGKKQIRIAETEKYPHVTFFFSGGREAEFEGERRLLCSSPKVATYDLKPEMSAFDIRDKIVPELNQKSADFICLNFANADMVGHTGVFSAAVSACEAVDQCAKDVTHAALENDYLTIIIADHGNSDIMINPDGSPNTAHTTNLVPCIFVDKEIQGDTQDGKLADLAPTILNLMGINIPTEMDGNILIKPLNIEV